MAKKQSQSKNKKPAKPIATLLAMVIVALLYLWDYYPQLFPVFSSTLPEGEIKVHYIDVGQGDSILIQAADKTVLIDGGETDQGDVVSGYLRKLGVRKVDILIGTHPHSDHIGGLAAVVDHFVVEMVLMPDVPEELIPTSRAYLNLLTAIDAQGAAVTVSSPGERFDLGDEATLTILGPLEGYDDLNNLSIVCRLDCGNSSFLFTGDMERAAEVALLDEGCFLRADVLKLGHHGSRTSSHAAFLEAVRPKVGIACMGAGNSYGHPHPETLERMEPYGPVYRLDLLGSIVITTDGLHIWMESEKGTRTEIK